ncbi:MAG: hypothetical protein IH877_06970 [Gemmatimonadetes bacterium]|nr:hypothetical protein [Gemmatimonadota bacterium]
MLALGTHGGSDHSEGGMKFLAATLGAGAVLTEGMVVPPGSLVVGVPARVVREVGDELRERIESTWKHYVAEAEEHRTGRYPHHR